MHYMVPLFFYTHNFVIEEVLHYIKELYKFYNKWIKKPYKKYSGHGNHWAGNLGSLERKFPYVWQNLEEATPPAKAS
jgi:hypothetical protein